MAPLVLNAPFILSRGLCAAVTTTSTVERQKCHKAFFKPDDYRSVFYLVKPSCPPRLSFQIHREKLLCIFWTVSIPSTCFFFFFRCGAGGTFYFLHVTPNEESSVWKRHFFRVLLRGGGEGRLIPVKKQVSLNENGSDGGCGVLRKLVCEAESKWCITTAIWNRNLHVLGRTNKHVRNERMRRDFTPTSVFHRITVRTPGGSEQVAISGIQGLTSFLLMKRGNAQQSSHSLLFLKITFTAAFMIKSPFLFPRSLQSCAATVHNTPVSCSVVQFLSLRKTFSSPSWLFFVFVFFWSFLNSFV